MLDVERPHLILNDRDILIPVLVIHVQVGWVPVATVTILHPLQGLAVDKVVQYVQQRQGQLLTRLGEGVWST